MYYAGEVNGATKGGGGGEKRVFELMNWKGERGERCAGTSGVFLNTVGLERRWERGAVLDRIRSLGRGRDLDLWDRLVSGAATRSVRRA